MGALDGRQVHGVNEERGQKLSEPYKSSAGEGHDVEDGEGGDKILGAKILYLVYVGAS